MRILILFVGLFDYLIFHVLQKFHLWHYNLSIMKSYQSNDRVKSKYNLIIFYSC